MCPKLEWAAGRENLGVVRRSSIGGERSEKCRGAGVAGQQFVEAEGTDKVGAETGSKWKAKRGGETAWHINSWERNRLGSGKIRVEDKEGARGIKRGGRLQDSNRMRDSGRKGRCSRGEQRHGSREGKAIIVDMVEFGKNVVIKMRGKSSS
jgi:hypothetical protein